MHNFFLTPKGIKSYTLAQNKYSSGAVLDWTNGTGAAVSSGSTVKIGTLIGVATIDIADGATGSVETTGVWMLPKTTSQAWTQGVALYWDATNSKFTTTATSNTFAGNAALAAASADTTGYVRLST